MRDAHAVRDTERAGSSFEQIERLAQRAATRRLLGVDLRIGTPSTGGDGGNGGTVNRTPAPSNVVLPEPEAAFPGSIVYAKAGNIWIQTDDKVRQLTQGGDDSMPSWSPDGTAIVFEANTDGGGLYTVNADGTVTLVGNVTDNAILAFNRTGTLTYAGVISGTGGLTKTGNGTLVVEAVDGCIVGHAEPDEEVQDLLRASHGTNLGMDFLPGSLGLERPDGVDPAFAGQVLWFDALTQNVDRSWRNPNLLRWHGRPWLIDHGATLAFHHRWATAASSDTRPYDASTHALSGCRPDVAAADADLEADTLREILSDGHRALVVGALDPFEAAAKQADDIVQAVDIRETVASPEAFRSFDHPGVAKLILRFDVHREADGTATLRGRRCSSSAGFSCIASPSRSGLLAVLH